MSRVEFFVLRKLFHDGNPSLQARFSEFRKFNTKPYYNNKIVSQTNMESTNLVISN